MIEFKCAECGKVCYAKIPSRITKFCSLKCVAINREKNKKILERGGAVDVQKFEKCTCATCGKEFLIEDYKINSVDTKRYCSRECFYNKPFSGEYRKCLNCGKEFYTTKKRNIRFCSVKCGAQHRYKNAKLLYKSQDGYIVSNLKNGKNKMSHRKIIEEILGRDLEKNEVVHHINGIKDDNRIENLLIMSRAGHTSFHRQNKLHGVSLEEWLSNNNLRICNYGLDEAIKVVEEYYE